MKKRPKRSKFIIPSKSGRRKAKDFDYSFEDTDASEDRKFKRLEKLWQTYEKILNNFYNKLVPNELKVSKDSEFTRADSINNNGYFGNFSFYNDIMFSFLGYFQLVPPEFIMKILVEESSKTIREATSGESFTGGRYYEELKKKNIELAKRKVLCIVQEKPTEEFLDRDILTIDRNDEFFRDYTGEWADYVIDYFNEDLGTTDVLVKVINEENNPKAFKDYLRLRNLRLEIDDFDIF